MFLEALQISPKTWGKLRHPSVGKWINFGTFRQ